MAALTDSLKKWETFALKGEFSIESCMRDLSYRYLHGGHYRTFKKIFSKIFSSGNLCFLKEEVLGGRLDPFILKAMC